MPVTPLHERSDALCAIEAVLPGPGSIVRRLAERAAASVEPIVSAMIAEAVAAERERIADYTDLAASQLERIGDGAIAETMFIHAAAIRKGETE